MDPIDAEQSFSSKAVMWHRQRRGPCLNDYEDQEDAYQGIARFLDDIYSPKMVKITVTSHPFRLWVIHKVPRIEDFR